MKSRVFYMPHSKMLAYLFSVHGKVWLIVAASIVIALIILSIALHDLRYVICGLMVIFIIIPMIMSFLYLNYALIPAVAFNVLPHSLQLDGDGINILIYPKKSASKDKEITEEEHDPVSKIIKYSDLINYTVGLDSVYFKLSGNGFLYIPTAAFESQMQFNDFVTTLCESKEHPV